MLGIFENRYDGSFVDLIRRLFVLDIAVKWKMRIRPVNLGRSARPAAAEC